jgi:AcrR family transcriptional regulator
MGNVKEAEERKKEILDVAEELFISKGYDSTSTTDILERVGIARGTLYYHFKSKEEILDALIDRIIRAMVSNICMALSDKTTSIHKLISFVAAMKVDSVIGKEITDYAHKPQNALMHQKIHNSLLAVLTPIAAEIIEEGIKEGSFSTNYPKESAEMLLIYSSIAFDDMNETAQSEMERKVAGFIYNMERLLGTKQGSLSEIISFIN